MSIKIQDLKKTYGKQIALNNISFETQPNNIIGFLGPNGAGKSTTMKILAGIIPANSGNVEIANINIKSNVTKKIIGYLAEDNPLYQDMYVREILTFEAKVHGISTINQRVEEVIKLTGLEKEHNKKVSQLSKGYKQRVGLAMAIIHNPKVLILDEPTSGLDPNQIIEIRSLIKLLAKDKTVLFSTHIMQEVEAICDEVVIINQGNIKDHFALIDKTNKYPNMSMEDIFVSLTKS